MSDKFKNWHHFYFANASFLTKISTFFFFFFLHYVWAVTQKILELFGTYVSSGPLCFALIPFLLPLETKYLRKDREVK